MKPEITTLEEYRAAYRESLESPETFWRRVAHTFVWKKEWDKIQSGGFENADFRWFEGGKLNLCENCIDHHLYKHGNKTAIIWEPNDPEEDRRHITYNQLHLEVCRFANVLKANGVRKGDRVCLYMPMTPEAAIAMLACARIGAIHSVVFGGFSANALADRINDSQCKLLVTADGAFRGEKIIPLKEIANEAMLKTPSIQTCIVLQRTGKAIEWERGRDKWWHNEMENAPNDCPAEVMDAEDPLFILYTSGSTGKPKGLVHTTGGYMVGAGYTFRNVFQIKDNDIFWCTADVGWITGHTYIVYGPLLNGATTVMFEGVPNYPDYGRFWDVIDRSYVTIFYTAPTAIRALEAAGLEWFKGKRLNTLRVLGSVGEPINLEAWEWYHDNVGKQNCPVVDTWWQTETGSILISALAGITPLKPTFATLPLPGIEPLLVDADGKEIGQDDIETEGNLCIRRPWPSLARTTWGDHDRFVKTYFRTYKGLYFTGDGARRDVDGNYRITGRVDDVINVSGHRIGTAEVENAINEHDLVVESAVVGYPHDIKGQALYAFVICHAEVKENEKAKLIAEIKEIVNQLIGPFARPDKIQVVSGLPKTRSGKIMRRILRKLAEGEFGALGDTSTLLDPNVVEEIKRGLV